MERKDYTLTYEAIQSLVSDLWSVHKSTQNTPLSLYRRLMQKEDTDINQTHDKMNNYVQGFRVFLSNYEESVKKMEDFVLIPKGTVIRYKDSERVYLEIQKYIYKADNEEKEIIRKHLLTIAATIDPDEKTLTALESAPILEKFNIKGNGKEGQFVSDIMRKAKKAMENSDADDPTTAIMGLLSSGVVTDMVKGLQGGVESGAMDMTKLLTSMQGALSEVIESNKDGENDGKASNIDMDSIMFNVQKTMSKTDEQ